MGLIKFLVEEDFNLVCKNKEETELAINIAAKFSVEYFGLQQSLIHSKNVHLFCLSTLFIALPKSIKRRDKTRDKAFTVKNDYFNALMDGCIARLNPVPIIKYIRLPEIYKYGTSEYFEQEESNEAYEEWELFDIAESVNDLLSPAERSVLRQLEGDIRISQIHTFFKMDYMAAKRIAINIKKKILAAAQ